MNKIDFTQFDDEKLKRWLWSFEQMDVTRILYDTEGLKLYKEALDELLRRGL